MIGKFSYERFQTSKPDVNDSNAASAQRILPIMSFKSFMQNQHDNLPPEAFQKMYDQYNIDYLSYFSDAFFKASMGEEWFQDRYNPINIVAIEKESAAWAVAESAKFKQELLSHTTEAIQACSLDPVGLEKQPRKYQDEDSVETTETPVSGKFTLFTI